MLGAHVSIAGGVDKAPHNGHRIGCEAIQIFTRNQMQWRARPLELKEIDSFVQGVKECQIKAVAAHDSYLINLCSPDRMLLRKSLKAFAEELDRCERLRIPYLVFHPGAHLGVGERKGLQRIAKSIDLLLSGPGSGGTQLLLETTAGQGTNLGYRFEHFAEILDQVKNPERVAICLDTCHVFAAGYDIRNAENYQATLSELERIVGISKIKLFHLNDSKKGLGSRVDRHENIGLGALGVEPFRLLLNDERFVHVPKVLETPGGDEAYRSNLKTLRALVGCIPVDGIGMSDSIGLRAE